MPAPSANGGVIRFGPFEVDLAARELRRQGRKIGLQEQPFRVLVLLLQRPGQVVTREELQQAIWPVDTFVEFDHGLNTAIKKIRQALDDSAENPRFVETLPRQGYRFLGPVQNSQTETSLRPSRHALVWLSVLLGAALIGIASAWFAFHGQSEDHIEPIPVTTYPGAETGPTLSPDGTQVAFTSDGEKRDNFDIYVKRIGSEAAKRLTTDPGLDFGAAWSPDGRYIAFLRPLTPDSTGVFLISPEGGTEKRVGEVSVLEDFLVGPYLAWLADSKWLFTIDKAPDTPFFHFTALHRNWGKAEADAPAERG